MGRLDSSSEKNSLCRIVLPVAWRLAGRVKLNPKKKRFRSGFGIRYHRQETHLLLRHR